MTKNIITSIRSIFFSAPFLAMAMGSCSSSDEPNPKPIIEPEVTLQPRTVLVYMVASNSLGVPTASESNQFDALDLKEMQAAATAGFPEGSDLLVYHVRKDGQAPTLSRMTADGPMLLKTYPTEITSVTSQRMTEVIDDMLREAPARHYGLVLWGHASGWVEDGIESARPYSYGYDQTVDPGAWMNTTTLAQTLPEGIFDYIYFDCCYMASVEVAYQLRHVASGMVASSAETAAPGMPYDLALPLLMQEKVDLADVAHTVYDYYMAMPNERDRNCAISAIDLTKIEALAQQTAALYDQHPTLPSTSRPQQFQNRNCLYFDLEDYIKNLEFSESISLEAWETALHDAVLYQAATPKIRLQNTFDVKAHCGLTTYILSSSSGATKYGYNRLDWWNDVASRLF